MKKYTIGAFVVLAACVLMGCETQRAGTDLARIDMYEERIGGGFSYDDVLLFVDGEFYFAEADR